MERVNEIWKDIKNYEDYYQASNLGRIRSLPRYVNAPQSGGKRLVKGKIIKQSTSFLTKNYSRKTLKLSKKGKSSTYNVHRIIAETFLPNVNDNLEVNHIDSNPTNNHIDNLEWVTHKENMVHSSKYGNMNKSYDDKNICKQYIDGKSPRKLMIVFNISARTITKIITRNGITPRTLKEAWVYRKKEETK